LRCLCRTHPHSQDEAHPLLDQLSCGDRQLGEIALREPHAQKEVLIFAVAQLLQTVSQADDARRRSPRLSQRPDADGTGALGTTHIRGDLSTEHPQEGDHNNLPPFHTMGLHACPPAGLLPSSPLDLRPASIAPFTVGVYHLTGNQTSELLEDFMKII